MEATGMPDGEYALGGQKVIKTGNLAALEDGTIAGSATNLDGLCAGSCTEDADPIGKCCKMCSCELCKICRYL